MFEWLFGRQKRKSFRTLSATELERILGRKPGLFQRLGDAGEFLKELFGSHRELSVDAVEERVANLKNYRATCYEKMDQYTVEKGRTFRQLEALQQELRDPNSPPWRRATLKAKAEEEMFAYRSYDATLRQWQQNVRAATVIITQLERLIGLMARPMREGELDAWATELQLAAEAASDFAGKIEDLQRAATPVPPSPTQGSTLPLAESLADLAPSEQDESQRETNIQEELKRLLEQ